MRGRLGVLVWIGCILGLISCGIRTETGPQEDLGEAPWEKSSPEEQGVDSRRLGEMLNEIGNQNLKIRSVLLIRNDRLILESYVHPYSRTVPHDVKSVSKSVISAVVGVALSRGILSDLEQPVAVFLPEYFPNTGDPRKRAITLRHLLTMSSGLDLDENGPVMQEVMAQDDWIRGAFARPMVSGPGEEFDYCTFLTHAMSGVLTRASGRSLGELTDTLLFHPLGIIDSHWEKDPQGYDIGGDRLWLRPLDMARIGALFLGQGIWEGRPIIPKEWVEESVRNRFPGFEEDGYSGYGFWWWLSEDGGYHARGAGGQMVSVYPSLETVIVLTGADTDAAEDLLKRHILPAIVSEEPLPPNPAAMGTLEALVAELENPAPQPTQPVPESIEGILAKRFVLEGNDLGFSDLTLSCEAPDTCQLRLGSSPTPLTLDIGMDGRYRTTRGVSWGMRTDGNDLALRGEWVGESEIQLDLHEIGEPFYFDVNLTFGENRVAGTFIWHPFNREIDIRGVLTGGG